jgi:hypothetical protein
MGWALAACAQGGVIALDAVEFLVMKAVCIGVIDATIDQVRRRPGRPAHFPLARAPHLRRIWLRSWAEGWWFGCRAGSGHRRCHARAATRAYPGLHRGPGGQAGELVCDGEGGASVACKVRR